jgi:hypothetical protein
VYLCIHHEHTCVYIAELLAHKCGRHYFQHPKNLTDFDIMDYWIAFIDFGDQCLCTTKTASRADYGVHGRNFTSRHSNTMQ